MTRVRAYTVAEAGRVLGMTSSEVHKAIDLTFSISKPFYSF